MCNSQDVGKARHKYLLLDPDWIAVLKTASTNAGAGMPGVGETKVLSGNFYH